MAWRIAAVETLAVNDPVAGYFKFFAAGAGRPPGRGSVVVKITCDDGTAGWGQSVPSPRWSYETLETVQTTIERYLAPELIGCDPLAADELHQRMNRAIAPSFSTGQPIAKAGIDLALFDLCGRLLGQSPARRWQRPTREWVTLSWTLNPRTLDEVAALVEEGRARGYRHYNVKVAPDADFDVAMCRLVRELAPQAFLWADANGGYDLETALSVAPRLADAGVDVFEQPLPPNRLRGYRRLKQQAALPIIMDEGIVSCVDLDEFLALDLLDGVALKVARSGGLSEAVRIAQRVGDAGLMLLGSGLTDPDLSLAASLALYGAFDLQYPAALNGPQFLTASLLTEPIVVQDGRARVPQQAGLGVAVDPARLAALRIDDVR